MTVIQELEQTVAMLGAAKAEAAAAREALAKAQAEHTAAIAAVQAQLAAKDGEIAEGGQKLTNAETLVAKLMAENEATTSALDKARRALANPAFADAMAIGASAVVADQAAPPTVQPMTFEQAHSEYIRIRDTLGAKAAADFRAQHAEILKIK
jgi:hypothetical protein